MPGVVGVFCGLGPVSSFAPHHADVLEEDAFEITGVSREKGCSGW